MGQQTIATAAMATKWGRNEDNNKYDSRGEEETADGQTADKSAIGDSATYWARWRQLYAMDCH